MAIRHLIDELNKNGDLKKFYIPFVTIWTLNILFWNIILQNNSKSQAKLICRFNIIIKVHQWADVATQQWANEFNLSGISLKTW